MSRASWHRSPHPAVLAAAALTAATAVAATAWAATATKPRPTPPIAAPEQVAAAFTAGYLSFRWDDAPDAFRRRCRPWDTDEVDRALTADRTRRTADREIDHVEIRAVNAQDRAPDHLDATVVATINRTGPAGPATTVIAYLDLRVVATPNGWLVAQVDQ